MTTQTEALKLALEQIKAGSYECAMDQLEEALAQPEQRNISEQQEPVAVYGYCPECGAKGAMRERRLNGNDKCASGHTYPSREAATPPQRKPLPIERHHRNVGVRIGSTLYPVSVVRAIEAAHGIKE